MAKNSLTTLDERAAKDLAFIRQTMAARSTFTSVSGKSMTGVAVLGIIGSLHAFGGQDFATWLTIWLVIAAICTVISVIGMVRKDSERGTTRNLSLNLRFAMSIAPAFIAAALLTIGYLRFIPDELLFESRQYLVAMWLLLYGAGIVTSAMISIRPVLYLGGSVACTGTVLLLIPSSMLWAPEIAMALAFGFAHLIIGAIIWRDHGG